MSVNRGSSPIVAVLDGRSGLRDALELLLLGRADVRPITELEDDLDADVVVVRGDSARLVVSDLQATRRVVIIEGPEVLEDLTEAVSSLLPRPIRKHHTAA